MKLNLDVNVEHQDLVDGICSDPEIYTDIMVKLLTDDKGNLAEAIDIVKFSSSNRLILRVNEVEVPTECNALAEMEFFYDQCVDEHNLKKHIVDLRKDKVLLESLLASVNGHITEHDNSNK